MTVPPLVLTGLQFGEKTQRLTNLPKPVQNLWCILWSGHSLSLRLGL